jgi:hypothetical protein
MGWFSENVDFCPGAVLCAIRKRSRNCSLPDGKGKSHQHNKNPEVQETNVEPRAV